MLRLLNGNAGAEEADLVGNQAWRGPLKVWDNHTMMLFTLSKICWTFTAGTQPSLTMAIIPVKRVWQVWVRKCLLKHTKKRMLWEYFRILPSSIFMQLTTVEATTSFESPSHRTPWILCPSRLRWKKMVGGCVSGCACSCYPLGTGCDGAIISQHGSDLCAKVQAV